MVYTETSYQPPLIPIEDVPTLVSRMALGRQAVEAAEMAAGNQEALQDEIIRDMGGYDMYTWSEEGMSRFTQAAIAARKGWHTAERLRSQEAESSVVSCMTLESSLTRNYQGKSVLATSLTGKPTIQVQRGKYREGEGLVYFHSIVRTDIVNGIVGLDRQQVVSIPDGRWLYLYAQKAGLARKNIRYAIPLLDEDFQPAVELRVTS